MNRQQILKHFTDNVKQYEKYARNIAGADDADDLFQECSLMLLEFPEDRLISYWNETQGLKPFWLRLLCNQYKSTTSKFHKQYRKESERIQKKGADIVYNNESLDVESPEMDMDDVIKASNSVTDNEMENMIWGLYVEHGSMRKALAAIPEEWAEYFNLKLVHMIVKKFQRSIKEQLNVL